MAFIKEIQIFKSDSPKATKWLQKQVIKSVARQEDLPSIDDYKVGQKRHPWIKPHQNFMGDFGC